MTQDQLDFLRVGDYIVYNSRWCYIIKAIEGCLYELQLIIDTAVENWIGWIDETRHSSMSWGSMLDNKRWSLASSELVMIILALKAEQLLDKN